MIRNDIKTKPKLVICALVVVSAILGFQPVTAADSTDSALKQCLDDKANPSTADMMGYLRTAIDACNKELQAVLTEALHKLDPASGERLRRAQARWLAYRSAEHVAQKGPWQSGNGTMTGPEALDLEVSALKQRIAELRFYQQ